MAERQYRTLLAANPASGLICRSVEALPTRLSGPPDLWDSRRSAFAGVQDNATVIYVQSVPSRNPASDLLHRAVPLALA